jgi:apolipoprotein N-acyltransferase
MTMNEKDIKARWSAFKITRAITVLGLISIWLIFQFIENENAMFVYLFPIFAFTIPSGLFLTFWDCPRCGKRFAAKFWNGGFHVVWPWAKKCFHCGLPFGTIKIEK